MAFDRAADTVILRRCKRDDVRYMRSPPIGAIVVRSAWGSGNSLPYAPVLRGNARAV